MAYLLLTNSTRSDFAALQVRVSQSQLMVQLDILSRNTKQLFSISRVADALHKTKTCKHSEPAVHARYMLVVTPGKLELRTETEWVATYHAGGRGKPGINQIKDWRTRPAPFNRDGSCKG